MWGEIQSYVFWRDSSTGFYQKSRELLLQCLSCDSELLQVKEEKCNHGTKTTITLGSCFYNIHHLRLKVVQHDDVCSRSGCLPALLCWATLHLNLTAEAAHRAGSFHRLGSKQGCVFVFVCFLVSTANLMRAVRPELQNLDKGKQTSFAFLCKEDDCFRSHDLLWIPVF